MPAHAAGSEEGRAHNKVTPCWGVWAFQVAWGGGTADLLAVAGGALRVGAAAGVHQEAHGALQLRRALHALLLRHPHPRLVHLARVRLCAPTARQHTQLHGRNEAGEAAKHNIADMHGV